MQLLNHFMTLLLLSAVNLTSACPCHRRASSSTPSATSSSTVPTVAAVPTQDSFVGMTPAQIKAAAPDTASCNPSQTACRTAEQAAPFINASFKKFNFTTVGEQAALFSLMAFESGSFKFDINMFPGRPGQGTRNMMMFDFILPYALENNATAVHAIRPDLTSSSTAADVPNDDQKNQIRATVLGDELSFASAAWFLRTRCNASISEGLKFASTEAFNNYMGTGCINAGQDPARLELYQATLAAMRS